MEDVVNQYKEEWLTEFQADLEQKLESRLNSAPDNDWERGENVGISIALQIVRDEQ
jgi:hypothetical protein